MYECGVQAPPRRVARILHWGQGSCEGALFSKKVDDLFSPKESVFGAHRTLPIERAVPLY